MVTSSERGEFCIYNICTLSVTFSLNMTPAILALMVVVAGNTLIACYEHTVSETVMAALGYSYTLLHLSAYLLKHCDVLFMSVCYHSQHLLKAEKGYRQYDRVVFVWRTWPWVHILVIVIGSNPRPLHIQAV